MRFSGATPLCARRHRSSGSAAGVLRGVHFADVPPGQAKYVTATHGAVLETGCVYVVPLLESLALAADMSAAANPKSSTGRIDVFVRLVIDSANGRNALTGYARMAGSSGAPSLHWRILVRVDRAEILQSIWTVLWKLVGIAEICLVPLLGLFYWARHRQSVEETQASLARRALEANEARIRKIVDIALDAVITIDERGLVTGWNPQAEHIFGWRADEVIGQSLTTTIIPPRYREGHERGLRRYAETGTGPVLNKRIDVFSE